MTGDRLPVAAGAPVVLILAPGRDGALSAHLLEQAGRHCHRCADFAELKAQLSVQTGALLVAEELLASPLHAWLAEFVASQPAWSDLPVLVVAQERRSRLPAGVFKALGNVTVLTRPMEMPDLMSAVASALRARVRQFEVRDLLDHQREEARRKDEFLAMLAHELRNPLSPVRYAAQALRVEAGSPRAERLMDVIERQVAHMGRIITQLLDVSRLTRGMIRLELAPVDLSTLASKCLQARMDTAAHLRIAMDAKVGEPLWVVGDTTRLAQVIENLLDNALKFSRPGGRVTLRVQREDGFARLEVTDDGDGVAPEDLPYVFQPFVQADRTLERAAGGLGLGLAMVKGLTEQHGGRVEVRSDGLGYGTQFCVWLPLAEDQPGAEAAPEPEDAPAASTGLRILVAEDNADSADTLRLLLELSGYKVALARDGPDALRAARDWAPDVLLCDIGLPGMSGYQVARTLRAEPAGKNLCMVAITGYGTARDHDEALEAGFDSHFAKPVDPVSLMAEIERLKARGPAA